MGCAKVISHIRVSGSMQTSNCTILCVTNVSFCILCVTNVSFCILCVSLSWTVACLKHWVARFWYSSFKMRMWALKEMVKACPLHSTHMKKIWRKLCNFLLDQFQSFELDIVSLHAEQVGILSKGLQDSCGIHNVLEPTTGLLSSTVASRVTPQLFPSIVLVTAG
jgi:hypothetical protein